MGLLGWSKISKEQPHAKRGLPQLFCNNQLTNTQHIKVDYQNINSTELSWK